MYNHILDVKSLYRIILVSVIDEKNAMAKHFAMKLPPCAQSGGVYYYVIAAAACDVIVSALVQCVGEFQKTFDGIIYKYRYSLQ